LRANLVKTQGDAFKDYWLTQIDVHRQMVTAWIAHSQGKREEALQMLRTAADREDAIERDPVVPAPIVPARELLGEMLLESNQPQEALSAFVASLKEEPGRFWSLYGAAQAAERAGDRERAKTFYENLVAQTVHADGDRSALKAARTFLQAAKG
jgi:tetratricopeptide (TPR) repeat protein